MRRIEPELICPGHYDIYRCDKSVLDGYADYVQRKERLFRNLVGEPADHYIDLFWGRLLPYVAKVEAGRPHSMRLLLRNNLQRQATYEARLQPPEGWQASEGYESITLGADERGEIGLTATAPPEADGVRRLMAAELRIDGVSQGPLVEALVTVI